MRTGFGTFGNARHAIMPLRPAPLMRLWLHSREPAHSRRGRSGFHTIPLIRRSLLPEDPKDLDLPTAFSIYPKLLARVGSRRTSTILHVAHSNLRSRKPDPVSRTRIRHIGSPHQREQGRSPTNTSAGAWYAPITGRPFTCRGSCSDRAKRHPCRSRYCPIVKSANCGFV